MAKYNPAPPGKVVKGQTHYEDRDAMLSARLVLLQTYV